MCVERNEMSMECVTWWMWECVVEKKEMSVECVTWWMWECVLRGMKCQWNV